MNISKITSVILLCSLLLLFTGIFVLKKTDKEESILKGFVISFITLMCYHNIIVVLLKLMNLKFDISIIAISNIIMGILIILYSVKKRSFQKYNFLKRDVFIFAFVGIIGVVLGLYEFGKGINIQYISPDPAVHYTMATSCLRTGKTSAMFFSEINNAIFMSVFIPFLGSVVSSYKIFILLDICMLILSGLTLYVLVEKFISLKRHYIIIMALLILYMFGYPMNNMLYGFVYLGISVTLIGYIIILCDDYIFETDSRLLEIMIAVACLSLALCYMLYAPFIWIIVATCILYKNYKSEMHILAGIKKIFYMFIIPFILAIKFCYFDYFVGSGLDVSSAISLQGGIYINNISNFIPLIPFSAYSIWHNIKNKLEVPITLFCVSWSITVMLVIVLKESGFISPYYTYKFHYAWWLILFLTTIQGLTLMVFEIKKLILSIVTVVMIAIPAKYMNIEKNLSSSFALGDIYAYNIRYLKTNRLFDNYSIDIYRYINDAIKDKTDKPVPMVMSGYNYARWHWYNGMVGIDTHEFYTWVIDDDKYFEKISNGDADYIGVFYYDEMYQNHSVFFDKQEKLFENPSGAVYRIIDRKIK